MTLKLTITKAEYDKLGDDVKNEYKTDGDGFRLDVSGIEDTGELRRARDREKERADNLKDELATTTTELTTLKNSQTAGEKDVAKTVARFEKKIADKENEFKEQLSAKDKLISDTLINNTAMEMAGKISNSPKLMAKEIATRLVVEFGEDGTPAVKVTKDGKASDLKLDDLQKEVVANKDYSAILIGNRATGGGAPLRTPNPGGAGTGQTEDSGKPLDLANASPDALVESIRAKREAAQQSG